ncbi:slipin family protein [Gordonia sp. X0973]|uniref:slipin family protein n=1 Tax=Gordonia sp. X0973 TaxID=2742602 RepID=UPI000F527E97|nr:slipin family protein [Gordonia sp. X0973]QKT08762.1 slipin family protein [Gordonia sp. X0973]
MSIFNRRVVNPGEVVLEYRDGTLARILTPGAHRIRHDAVWVRVDTRDRIVHVAPQEVLTADGVPVRVSLAITLAVDDPVAFTERSEDPVAVVYLAAQVALRTECAAVAAPDLIGRTEAFDAQALTAAAAAAGDPVGIAVAAVTIRDVIAPHELRTATMELVTAQVRGRAKLEEARAETAALRSLANAGRLLDQHPALAQLRLVQAVPYGAKVVLAVGGADADAE